MIVTADARLSVWSAFTVYRESRLTPLNGANWAAVPVAGASPAGVLSGGA